KVSGRTAELLRGLSSNVKVVMTKSSLREKVTNRRRAEIANDAHADLCLRVHADSGGRSGFATYDPDRAATVQGTTGPSQDVLDRSH
ncbi:N-acetylmuramoyl-L-alanine amidase, partial [Acinetobacter baumannii]